MAPPKLLPLDKWLSYFQNNPLPSSVDPFFKDETVAGIRPCLVSDIVSDRMMIAPDKPDYVTFAPAEDVSPQTTYLDMDDTTYRRFLTGTGGLQYMKEARDKSGTAVPIGPSLVDLCRDTAPSTSSNPLAAAAGGVQRYAVYRTTNTILSNHPDLPALREVAFNFKPGEIIALVDGLKLDRTHYGVNETDTARLSLFPDLKQVDRMIDYIRSARSPIAADRRGPLIAALEETVSYERKRESLQAKSIQMQEDMRSDMRWQMFGMAALTVYTTLLATGKADPINKAAAYPIRGLFHLIRLPFDGGKALKRWWNDLAGEFRYRGLPTVLGSGTNLTELARRGEIRPSVDKGTEAMIEKIVNRISTPRRAGSAIVEAPPGWGKEILMRNLALENPLFTFIQTQPDDLMAGTMYRGQLEEKLKNIPKEIEAALERGQRVILCIDEFHEAITAGKNMEETRSLLDRWKGPLAKGTLRIVGFSTPDEMLKVRYMAGLYDSPESRDFLGERAKGLIAQWEADPAKFNIKMSENIRPLLNRFLGLEAPVRTEDDMKAILGDEVERMKAEDGVTLKIEPKTVALIVKLSESPVAGEGYIPRRAFDLFDGVIASVSEKTDMGKPIEVTHAGFVDYVKTSWPVVAKRFGLIAGSPLAAAAATPKGAAPAPAFERGDFVDLLKAKFQRIEAAVDGKTLQTLADFAYDEWEKKGKPMETVGGYALPSETILSDVLARARSVADATLKPLLTEAIRGEELRRAEGKTMAEGIPFDLKAKAGK